MTREELIEILHVEQELLDSKEEKEYEKAYDAIRFNVSCLTDKDEYWRDQLNWYFAKFRDWDSVRRAIQFGIDYRDARAIRFATRDVDLHAEEYYVDDFGYLQNIDKDVLLQLIDRLLERLGEEQ